MSDVVVVGGGIVGAACAYYAARAGLAVTVVDRGPVGAGTTSRGEGNILVSDKPPGPELALALWSRELWLEVGAELGDGPLELERKGGLVVATGEPAMRSLAAFAHQFPGFFLHHQIHQLQTGMAHQFAHAFAHQPTIPPSGAPSARLDSRRRPWPRTA